MICTLWPWSRHRHHHREEVESLRRETDTARQRRIQAELDLLRANAQRAQSDQTIRRADQAADHALEAVRRNGFGEMLHEAMRRRQA